MSNLRAPTTPTPGFVESVLDALSKPLRQPDPVPPAEEELRG